MVQRVPNPVHPHRILCLSMLFHLRRYEEVQGELVGDLEVRDRLCPKQPLTNTSGHVVAITVCWFVQDPDGFLQTAKVRQMSLVSTTEPVFVSSLAHIPAPQAGNRCEQITREMVRDLWVSTYDDMVNYLRHAINEV